MISFSQMIDPGGIANWSVTHVDWSEGKWHPKLYNARDITPYLLRKIKVPLVLLFPLCSVRFFLIPRSKIGILNLVCSPSNLLTMSQVI